MAQAFEAFPSIDYVIITMPHQVPEFPLLQDFTRVTPQAHAHPTHELYVFHRYSLSHDLVVRPLIVSRAPLARRWLWSSALSLRKRRPLPLTLPSLPCEPISAPLSFRMTTSMTSRP